MASRTEAKGLWSPDTGALFLPVGMVPAMELTLVEDRTQALPPWFGLSGGGPGGAKIPDTYSIGARRRVMLQAPGFLEKKGLHRS